MSIRPNPLGPRSAGPVNAAESGDWTAKATDTIEQAVSLVRDKATVPARTTARALVYGISLLMVVVVAVTLAVIAALRISIVYLPAGTAPNGQPRVWVSYVLIGGILTIVALFLLAKAERISRESE